MAGTLGSPKRLDVQFTWPAGSPLLEQLRKFTTTLQSRLSGVETKGSNFDAAVANFNNLGVLRINETLVPLVSEAITRLTDATKIFEAHSSTSLVIGTGIRTLVVDAQQRYTFAVGGWVAIISDETHGMIGQVTSFDRSVGIMIVNVSTAIGEGTFADWLLTAAVPAPFSVVTPGTLNSAIAAAVAALVDSSPTTLDTLNEIATALGNDPNFATTMTTLLGQKAPLSSPALTDTPTAPTADPGTNTVQLATCAFVTAAISAIGSTYETLGEVPLINTQADNYTLLLSDKGGIYESSKATANTVTVPPSGTTNFPVKSRIDLAQYGIGQLSVVAGGGVTIRSRTGLKLAGQYALATLYKRATDEWMLGGDLVP